MNTAENCCEDVDLTKYSPKTATTLRKEFRFANPENPLPGQIEDRNELKEFFTQYKNVFIPYSGNDQTTSHTLLYFLYSLPDLSPTLGAVIGRIKRYSFGGKVEIVRRLDPVFNIENTSEVSEREKLSFYDFIKSNIKFHGSDGQEFNVRDFASETWLDYKKTGNAYVELVFTETLGEKSVAVHLHKSTHCLYLLTDKGQQKYIGISAKWDNAYISKYPPDIVPIYPGVIEKDGVKRTVVHLKNGNHVWYGRNDWMGCLQSAYNEFQNLDYRIKQTQSGFVGSGIIEYEEDNPEATYKGDDDSTGNIANDIDNNFTSRSDDPQTFVMLTRPYGARPMSFHQVAPNTDAEWVKTTGAENRKDIIVANQWSERLMGESSASGFSANVFLDEFKVIGKPIVKANQEITNDLLNIVVMEASKYLEVSEFDNLSLAVSSPYKELLEKLENAENADNIVGGGEIQPGE